MFYVLDYIVCFIIYVLIVLIVCGYLSLCERKFLAIIQFRIGPGLFLFGFLTPITDGLKLFLKFGLFLVSTDILYLSLICITIIITLFNIWFIIPLGYIIFFDVNMTIAIIVITHTIFNIVCVYGTGCYIFSSCFVYLSALRILVFSFIAETLMLLCLIVLFNLDSLTLFSLKEFAFSQLYMNNFFYLNFYFVFIFAVVILLDGLRIPFDYGECESELVAGIITEFSGIFFVLFSLSESNHCILNCIFFITVVFGGIFFSIKFICVLIVLILSPRAILCRFKITDVINFLSIFILLFILIFIVWSLLLKMNCIFN